MNKLAVVCCFAVLAGCASSRKPDEPLVGPPPATAGADTEARLVQMQTSMTELLERLDVVNQRIARLEASAAAAEARAAAIAAVAEQQAQTVPQASMPPAGARTADSYLRAVQLASQGKLEDARRAFQKVFDADPTGELADGALYWIGETYFRAGDYATAIRWYRRVTAEFADKNKAPEALFKIALSYEMTGDLAMARQTLEEVIRRYPYSSPAASAKNELKRIKY